MTMRYRGGLGCIGVPVRCWGDCEAMGWPLGAGVAIIKHIAEKDFELRNL